MTSLTAAGPPDTDRKIVLRIAKTGFFKKTVGLVKIVEREVWLAVRVGYRRRRIIDA